jgi:hypothetical protein
MKRWKDHSHPALPIHKHIIIRRKKSFELVRQMQSTHLSKTPVNSGGIEAARGNIDAK